MPCLGRAKSLCRWEGHRAAGLLGQLYQSYSQAPPQNPNPRRRTHSPKAQRATGRDRAEHRRGGIGDDGRREAVESPPRGGGGGGRTRRAATASAARGPSRRPPRRGLNRASPYGTAAPRRLLPTLPVASRIFPSVAQDHAAAAAAASGNPPTHISFCSVVVSRMRLGQPCHS